MLIAIVLIVSAVGMHQPVFGNYYVGGVFNNTGPSSTGWRDEKVWGRGNYPALPSSTGSWYLHGVYSTAGWSNQTGALTGWLYQNEEAVNGFLYI